MDEIDRITDDTNARMKETLINHDIFTPEILEELAVLLDYAMADVRYFIDNPENFTDK